MSPRRGGEQGPTLTSWTWHGGGQSASALDTAPIDQSELMAHHQLILMQPVGCYATGALKNQRMSLPPPSCALTHAIRPATRLRPPQSSSSVHSSCEASEATMQHASYPQACLPFFPVQCPTDRGARPRSAGHRDMGKCPPTGRLQPQDRACRHVPSQCVAAWTSARSPIPGPRVARHSASEEAKLRRALGCALARYALLFHRCGLQRCAARGCTTPGRLRTPEPLANDQTANDREDHGGAHSNGYREQRGALLWRALSLQAPTGSAA